MTNQLTEKQKQDGWQVVKFGEIAKEVKGSTKTPIEDGLKYYVGLEHLDPQSLRIQRKGMIAEDTPSFTRLFKSGQILFGKRRCYQKKAAVADFEGICSGDIIVMEAIPGKIIPELLLFIIQSEMFFDWAEKTSSGSLSPRTKWKALAEFEFPLPPLERQKEILKILGKAEKVVNYSLKRLQQIELLETCTARDLLLQGLTFNQIFGKKEFQLPKGWKRIPLGNVIDRIQYGLSDSVQKKGQYPILRMMNIERGYVVPNDLKYIDLDSQVSSKFILQKDDILFNRTNSMDWVGRTGLFKQKGEYVFASYLLRINVNTKMTTAFYLNQYLNLPLIQYRLKAYATPGVSQANINPNSLRQLPFLLPPLKHVVKSDTLLEVLDKSYSKNSRHHQSINHKNDRNTSKFDLILK